MVLAMYLVFMQFTLRKYFAGKIHAFQMHDCITESYLLL